MTSGETALKFADIDRRFEESRQARHDMNERWTEALAHAMEATEETEKAVTLIAQRVGTVDEMRTDVAEIKAVLKGDAFGNKGLVEKVNWMMNRMIVLNAACGALVVLAELYRAIVH